MQNGIATVYLLLTGTTDYSECLRGCSPSNPSSVCDVTDYSECLLLSGFTDYSERLWALRFCIADQSRL